MNATEISKLKTYFVEKFGLTTIDIRARERKTDSAEVYLGDEFIGVIFRDDEDGDVSYDFNMASLEIDLPE
ncbi:MAG: DUF3126 family protein [Pseudomonadota bacterium]